MGEGYCGWKIFPPQHSLPECVQALYPILAHTAFLKVGFQAADLPRSLVIGSVIAPSPPKVGYRLQGRPEYHPPTGRM